MKIDDSTITTNSHSLVQDRWQNWVLTASRNEIIYAVLLIEFGTVYDKQWEFPTVSPRPKFGTNNTK